MSTVTPELQQAVEQWYYREARLLDNRQYQTWLGLCCEDISYSMPARTNPLVNNREQGNESMISVERELEDLDSDGCPIRDENIAYLFLRVDRSFKMNAWAENPPSTPRASNARRSFAFPRAAASPPPSPRRTRIVFRAC